MFITCILCWVPNKSLSTFERKKRAEISSSIFLFAIFSPFLPRVLSGSFVVSSRKNIRVRSIPFKRYRYTNRDECGRFIFGTNNSFYVLYQLLVYVFFFPGDGYAANMISRKLFKIHLYSEFENSTKPFVVCVHFCYDAMLIFCLHNTE